MTKTNYFRSGTETTAHLSANVKIYDKLEPGNYIYRFTPNKGSYLVDAAPFTQLPKYYGNVIERTNMILKTVADRQRSTGILMSGIKGTGKTLLARNVICELYKQGVPSIMITDDVPIDQLKDFLSRLEQPCVLFIDEFEKVFKREEQDEFLSLFDGVSNNKFVFILTCNDIDRVSFYLRNRPGRLYYHFKYGRLTEEEIIDFCADNLKVKKRQEES